MAVAQKRAQTITATTGGTFNLPNNTAPGTATAFVGTTATKNQNVYGATGPFSVKFGTGTTNNVYFTGGSQGATSVTGLAGNDSMILRGNANGTYTVNMGVGRNTISLVNAWGTVAYTNTNTAATTYDTLDVSNVTSNFTSLSLLATTGAVATTSGAIANVSSMRALKLGSGTSTVVLNNLDDTLTFGNGAATVTGGTGNDEYAFNNFTGAANVTHSITDAAGTNTLDLSNTTSTVSVTFTGGKVGSANIAGTGAGLGKSATVTFAGAGGITDVIGGSGADTFSFGNTAGTHSVNGGTGSNTLQYTGSQGVTLDVRDHDLTNVAGTTNITHHGINTFKILGSGNNTIIGDGTTGKTFHVGSGTNYVDTLGGAATVNSNMGGNTTVVLGNAYGAMNVSNTAGTGSLTIDGSALTAATTVALGVGDGTAKITDGQASVSSVTWASTSKVTGFIGNDQATTVTAAGNLNFSIATGSGADTITASGTGNSTINTGSGADTVTVGNGNNVIIFGSTSAQVNTLTAGDGNNSIFLGAGTTAATIGNGDNIIDFSNGGIHTVTLGTGINTLQGFSSGNSWTVTLDNDQDPGADGILDLSNYASTDITWDDTFGGGNLTDLSLTAGGNTITIANYFDNSAATAAGSAAGAGAFTKIIFSDDANFTFADLQAVTTTAAFV